MIKQFFVEFFCPAKKCARVGHVVRKRTSLWVASHKKAKELVGEKLIVFGYPPAVQLRKTEEYCKRCGKVIKTSWEKTHSINRLTYETGGEFDRNEIVQISSESDVKQ